ncbi:hypothetical protein AVEN_67531-1, partial [Araneus ventricosus]
KPPSACKSNIFPYPILPLTQSTCRSFWTEESGSEWEFRIRTGSPSPNPNGESGSAGGVRVLNEERVPSFWAVFSAFVSFVDPDLGIRPGVKDQSVFEGWRKKTMTLFLF